MRDYAALCGHPGASEVPLYFAIINSVIVVLVLANFLARPLAMSKYVNTRCLLVHE